MSLEDRSHAVILRILLSINLLGPTKTVSKELEKRTIKMLTNITRRHFIKQIGNLKRLFDYLKEKGQLDNTVIIYTGDQGMFLGEHDYIDKRWMYEESMRMPLLVLYDLENDPYEMQNVYGEPAYKDITASLKKQLKQKREQLGETDEKYPHIQAIIDKHWND